MTSDTCALRPFSGSGKGSREKPKASKASRTSAPVVSSASRSSAPVVSSTADASEHAGMATTSDRPLPVPPEKYILLFEQCLFCGAKKNHKSKRTFKDRPAKEDIPKHMTVLYTKGGLECGSCEMKRRRSQTGARSSLVAAPSRRGSTP